MEIIDGSEPVPSQFLPSQSSTTNPTINPEYTTWLTRDQTALGWILATSTKSIITQLTNHTTSAFVWSYLASSYAAQSTARAASLRMKLQTLRKGTLPVTDFIQQIVSLSDQLAVIGEPISDTEYQTHLFRGLGSDFAGLATAISVHTQTQSLSRSALHSLILSHEGRLDFTHEDPPPPPAAFTSYPGQFSSPPNPSPRPFGSTPSPPFHSSSQPGLLPRPSGPQQYQYSQRGGVVVVGVGVEVHFVSFVVDQDMLFP